MFIIYECLNNLHFYCTHGVNDETLAFPSFKACSKRWFSFFIWLGLLSKSHSSSCARLEGGGVPLITVHSCPNIFMKSLLGTDPRY